jgi:putative nucleotidyltransferase with HDIG domain
MVSDRGGMAEQRVMPRLMTFPPGQPQPDGAALEVVLQHPSIRLAFEALDTGTWAHLRRVGELAGSLAAFLGLPSENQKAARIAGLLHDLGKSLVPGAILNKPVCLGPDELLTVRRHPLYGEVLARSLDDPTVLDAIRHHHERLDGSGYPDGQDGAAMSEVARVVAVADVFDALTSNRPYRAALPSAEALQRMLEMAGTKLDPDMVDALVLVQSCSHRSAA